MRTRDLGHSELVDLDNLPFLDYTGLGVAEGEWALVMSSRGCPYTCSYCYRQHRVRRCHSMRYFVDHLEFLRDRFGLRAFRIDDEVFTLDRARCLAICEEILRRGLDITFDCYSRVNRFDHELAAALRRAGCRMVWFGIESGADELLASMNKGQTAALAARAVAEAKRAGLAVCCNVLVGYPGETQETILRTLLFLGQLRPDRLSVQRLRVMPGTEVFEHCREQGVMDDEVWLLEDRDFAYEKDFSRAALDALVGLVQQAGDIALPETDPDLARYLILEAGRKICLCRDVSEQELRLAVRAGATSLPAVRKFTGATGGCGGCAKIVATLLRVWTADTAAPSSAGQAAS